MQVKEKEEPPQQSRCSVLTSIELLGVCSHSSRRCWIEGRFDKEKCLQCGQEFRRIAKKKRSEYVEYPAVKRKYFVMRRQIGAAFDAGFDVVEAGNRENAVWLAKRIFVESWNKSFPQSADGEIEVQKYEFFAKIYER